MSNEQPSRPVDSRSITGYDHETDVLVIGYGCAGAAAALEARSQGAEVIILERAGGAGGSSALSGGEIYLGGGTPIQQACGFTDSAGEMEAYLLAALGPHADAGKVRAYCRGSVDHYEWLTRQGVPFKPSFWESPSWVPPTDDGLMWLGENAEPFAGLAKPAPRGHRVTAEGFGGKVLMDRLVGAVNAAGAGVHTDTYATRLILEDSKVAGVTARRFGKTLTYRARRGVILTTGGFADNPGMVAQHAPLLTGWGVTSDGGDDGHGIEMAQAAGAGIQNMAAAQVGISLVPGLAVRGMLVNAAGQRFINEDQYPGLLGQAALFRQDLRVWIILDETAFEEVPEDERWGVLPHLVAETPEELEQEIGMPEGALSVAVAEYNRHAARGEDPYFHKNKRWLRPLEAPFAAIDVSRGMSSPELGASRGGAKVFTLGGLRTDTNGTVLDVSGFPVPGLYAAGRATSGLHGQGYISGTSLGDGTFFGRRAGAAAAAAG
ncbi:FAD-dependent oxidoreductase [Arthrobacter sp. APC 3897]|uniref:FAD-dependent oxidoreductase n=1 Tax=Arthrobacter sp. APC 3897 TaxID=3035204 RepID=UPI0025B2ED06|nr:FAD-dependent oxidoreductase [Arthrobacter sp. APC 3897]MDN3481696.1 FAD-dependent oxidoreductase [Arthrobacter sp. APC 3897]